MAGWDDDWRQAVTRILDADTGDLRALAVIAGADPRTLYIGTRLDGVDVRGQDLRGMNLENMDRSRIKHDEETNFDEVPDRLPLIYLSEPDVDRSSLGRLAHWTPLIIAEAEAAAFKKAAALHSGPIFILAWGPPSRSALEAAQALSASGIDYLLVIIDDARSLRTRIIRNTQQLPLEQPSLSVPSNASMLGFRRKVVTSESRDAMWVVADRWADRKIFFHGGDAWFARAKGVGAEPQRDAAAQIFDRLAGLSLSARRAIIVAPQRDPFRYGVDIDQPAMRLLDGEAVTSVAARHPRDDFHLAAFGPLNRREEPDDYLHATFAALWAREMTTRTPVKRRSHAIKTRTRRVEIRSDEESERPRPKMLSSDANFDLDQVNAIVLSERADITTVVDRLTRDRELWVTSRDVLALPLDGMDIRLLIAAQLRRVARAMGGSARRIYLELLLREALRDGSFLIEGAEDLLGALNRDDFSDRYDLSLSRLSVQPYGTTGLVRVAPLGSRDRSILNSRFDLDLKVDANGIQVLGRHRFDLNATMPLGASG